MIMSPSTAKNASFKVTIKKNVMLNILNCTLKKKRMKIRKKKWKGRPRIRYDNGDNNKVEEIKRDAKGKAKLAEDMEFESKKRKWL